MMNRLVRVASLLGSVALALTSWNVMAQGKADSSKSKLSVFQITQLTTQAILKNPTGNYFNYRLEGVCWWWHKHPFPHMSFTPYVKHYMPDLLVSVYNKYGANPFVEGNTLIDKAEREAGQVAAKAYFGRATASGSSGSTRRGLMNRFYEVDVVGNPAIYADEALMLMPHLKSVATPYKPYFSSLSDVITWRSPLAEIVLHPQDILPFVRNEGSMLMPWGAIFPRDGFITQPGGYKAAAVMALRGADIVTSDQAPHVVAPIKTGSCGWDRCTISPTHENDNEKVKWQRLYPDAQTDYDPKDFGKNDIKNILHPYGNNYMKDGDNNYVFMAWRKYEGCLESSGKLVKVVKY